MLSNSNKHQKSISKSDADEIAAKINALEKRFPLEFRIAMTETKLMHPVGGIRLAAICLLGIELAAEAYLLPIPSWILFATITVILFLPTSFLSKIWGSSLVLGPRERDHALKSQVASCVQDLDLEQTSSRNAILLFLNYRERRFYFWTDREIGRNWPEFQPSQLVNKFQQFIKTHRSLATALTLALHEIESICIAKWGQGSADQSAPNQIENSIAFWRP